VRAAGPEFQPRDERLETWIRSDLVPHRVDVVPAHEPDPPVVGFRDGVEGGTHVTQPDSDECKAVRLLDEATSPLDSESEALIQDALWALLSERTAIVIAHRLSTVRRIDRLVVLDREAIVEQSAHDAPVASDGIYAALWAHQSGGFLALDPEVTPA
jgi:hypothetical protein